MEREDQNKRHGYTSFKNSRGVRSNLSGACAIADSSFLAVEVPKPWPNDLLSKTDIFEFLWTQGPGCASSGTTYHRPIPKISTSSRCIPFHLPCAFRSEPYRLVNVVSSLRAGPVNWPARAVSLPRKFKAPWHANAQLHRALHPPPS
ncbi:hypothetical protein D9619_013455 [Psilocybe cf. subviscida]|uniref:Uncharacterized protein n=1 Tax=Psilocybe cf. subviscida TaxID=2480587 RepID=A0A8H5BSA8_9AGAR|nr:hypothetical protein D9619_013455 [Psilocybe cf. subviscida]